MGLTKSRLCNTAQSGWPRSPTVCTSAI